MATRPIMITNHKMSRSNDVGCMYAMYKPFFCHCTTTSLSDLHVTDLYKFLFSHFDRSFIVLRKFSALDPTYILKLIEYKIAPLHYLIL